MSFLEEIKNQYRYNDAVQKIIFWNVGIFILTIPFFYNFKQGLFSFPSFIALNSVGYNFLYFPYTLVTYAFLHADLMHLLFNMLMLYFSGRLFFTLFNTKQFLYTYFLGALFCALCFVVFTKIFHTENFIVGASGATIAVLFTVVFYAPNMLVRLLLIGEVKLWYIGLFLFLTYLLSVGLGNMGGQVAHLSGVVFGFINYKLLTNGVDISKWFQFKLKKKNHNFKNVYVNQTSTKKPTENPDINQKQIDDILDKISKSGYDSLTQQEKEFLFKLNK